MHYKRLREIRREKNATQEIVAEMLGLRQTQYSRYERGESEVPLDIVRQFAWHFQISIDYIAELTNEKRSFFRESDEMLARTNKMLRDQAEEEKNKTLSIAEDEHNKTRELLKQILERLDALEKK